MRQKGGAAAFRDLEIGPPIEMELESSASSLRRRLRQQFTPQRDHEACRVAFPDDMTFLFAGMF